MPLPKWIGHFFGGEIVVPSDTFGERNDANKRYLMSWYSAAIFVASNIFARVTISNQLSTNRRFYPPRFFLKWNVKILKHRERVHKSDQWPPFILIDR